ncbi:MAG: hypothetical protein AB7S26_30515 [Sandaracinaceae bacterium]
MLGRTCLLALALASITTHVAAQGTSSDAGASRIAVDPEDAYDSLADDESTPPADRDPLEDEANEEAEGEPTESTVGEESDAEESLDPPVAPEERDGATDELEPLDEPAEPTGPRFTAFDATTASPRDLTGPRIGLWLETGLTADGSDGSELFAWSTELGARLRIEDALVGDVSMGFTVADLNVSGTGTIGGETTPYADHVLRVEPGNPTFAGGYENAIADDIRLYLGFGLSIPTAARADVSNDAEGLAVRAASELAHRSAMAMRGYVSPWRWAPERISLFVPARVVARIRSVLLDGDAGIGLMLPVLGDRGIDPDVILQLGAGLGVEVAGPLTLGLRVHLVGGALGVVLPDAVLSLEPWLRVAIGDMQLGLRGSLNLTGADQIASRDGPSWNLMASVGGAL